MLLKELTEAPIPDDWDKEKINKNINNVKDFNDIIEYATTKAKKIGQGTSRVAFIIDYKGRKTVLKIAKNESGLAQNLIESKILSDKRLQKTKLLIPLIDFDTHNKKPRWIHVEYAPTDGYFDDVFIKEAGAEGEYIIDYVMDLFDDNHRNTEEENEQINKESYIVKGLIKLKKLYPKIALLDLHIPYNWGTYKNRSVIIDIGMDTNVSKKYYNIN